jgi:hypothetical protein
MELVKYALLVVFWVVLIALVVHLHKLAKEEDL